MKKVISIVMILLLLCGAFSVLSTNAAESDFVISNGVLVSYTGSDTKINVPSSVFAVGDSAFANNKKITSVTLPSTVYSIGNRAFYGCTSLSSVIGGTNVSNVGVYAFNDTPYFNNSDDEFFLLGKTLLWYNGDSQYITLPSSCVCIAPFAFLRCGTAEMFRASSELVSVGAGAFYECNKLRSVDLPASVTYIGAYAFEGTPFLSSLGEFSTLGDGIMVKYSGSASEVSIPDGVRRIASRAFSASKLTSVSVPGSVYSIDSYAFADCTSLRTLELSEGLASIGDGAFSGCKALSGLKTPASLRYIGQHAFDSSALEGISLSGSGLIVSDNAFVNCSSMKYALLSDGVSALYDNAFKGCTGLEGVCVPSSASEISSSALSGCKNALVTCASSSTAASALSGHKMNNVVGDADLDGTLTVVDATAIQRIAAELIFPDGSVIAAADFDFNGRIDVLDAEDIQLTIVKAK